MTVVTVASRVVAVTVGEDRAEVERTAELDLADAGVVELRIEGLAPVLVDGSLHVTAAGGSVVVARVERHFVSRDEDLRTELRELEERLAAARAGSQRIEARLAALGRELAAAGRAATLTLADLAEDAAWGRTNAGEWRAAIERVDTVEAAHQDALVEAEADLRDARRAVADLEARGAAARSPGDAITAAAVITVHAGGGPLALALRYLVPGACWRPAHTATLAEPPGEGPTLTLATDAVVWQHTGEEWTDVRLQLSTERPSLGTTPPALTTDRIVAQRVGKEVAVDVREEDVLDTGPGIASDVVPAIDDGGEVRMLIAAAAVTIASTGRPVRVPLHAFTAPAEVTLVAAPELSRAVVRRSVAPNLASQAVLAGPVDLVRDAGPAGRSQVRFAAPGERFAIGWGPEADLRVRREAAAVDASSRLHPSWAIERRTVTVVVTNLGAVARDVEVVERIPIAEVEQVRVELREATPTVQPDADGLLRWHLRVAPGAAVTATLAYELGRQRAVTGAT